jgi:hypothetical protein
MMGRRSPYEASILRQLGWQRPSRHATGLRNPYDLASTKRPPLRHDNGIDSDSEPFIPDELNLIVEGGFMVS